MAAPSFDIQTSEGSKDKLLKATLVARSEKPDLAILHCPELDAEPLAIDPTPLHRGTDIMTFGYPEMFVLGGSLKATRGVISAVPSSAVDDMYLYDAVINHGNSGGPVCDNHGNVVAVTTVMTNTEGKYGGGIPGVAALDFVSKHVPGYERIEPGRQTLDWPAVDQQAGPATVLVWVRSKTPGSSPALASAGYFEDRDCMVCNGVGILKCAATGCRGGMVIVQTGRSVSTQPCPVCKGKTLLACPVCLGRGLDPDLVRIEPTQPPPSSPPPSRSAPRSSGSRPSFGPPATQPPSDGSSLACATTHSTDACTIRYVRPCRPGERPIRQRPVAAIGRSARSIETAAFSSVCTFTFANTVAGPSSATSSQCFTSSAAATWAAITARLAASCDT